MLIRYHLLFYCISIILAFLSYYYHYLFILAYIIYHIFILYRFNYKFLLTCLLVSLLIFIPRDYNYEHTYIEGKVIKADENSCYVLCDSHILYLYHEYDLSYGDRIKAEIQYTDINENTNDYLFNQKTYLLGNNIHHKGKIISINEHIRNNSFYQLLVSKLSEHELLSSYQRLFVFGEKEESIEEDYSLLSELSLVHLFALSGMHVSILLKLIKGLLGMIFYEKTSFYISIILVGYYIFHIPPSVSLQRAYFCVLLYELLKDYLNKIDILSILVIISLIYNPYILYNISFVFSYFIYFIVLITKDYPHSSFYIYLSSIPIILNINYQIPVFSILFLYFITPFVEYFYIITIITLLCPYLSIIGIICVKLFTNVINFLNDINITLIFSKPSISFIIIYYFIYFYILYCIERKKQHHTPLCILLSLMMSFYFYSHYKIYASFTMIDVGQGDCTLIRLPLNQGNILIDTGGSLDYDIATTTLIPYLKAIGIDHLDIIYISHEDTDHCGALESLEKNFRVNEVVREYQGYRHIGDLSIRMLSTSKVYDNKNDNSLIMYLTYRDTSFLFTGDISEEVEKDLYNTYTSLDVDVLKVGHHGSATSTSAYLLSMINPKVAMIGVKKNNIYRHPASIVIDRLNKRNITILRTDEDGMFHIRFFLSDSYIFR